MGKCKNVFKDLNSNDLLLIEKAREVMKKNYDYDTHSVSAGILDSKNKMHFGISIKSPNGLNICAEPCTICNADMNSKSKKYNTIVAVKGKDEPPSIIPPCGICRELLNFHYPDIYVIIQKKDELKKIKAKYLLPYPYFSTRFPDRKKKLKTNKTWCSEGLDNKNGGLDNKNE